MITVEEHIELANAIDNVINVETQKFIAKDMHNMTQEGYPMPTQMEMPSYVQECRLDVTDTLTTSN
tara:strand:- start:517 stop:714 length:198 start_codon:yes stop_codon:yes gene_type:complete